MKRPVVKLNKSKEYTYICIYYKQRNNRILVNTGYKYHPESMTKELDFKDQYTNSLLMRWQDAVNRYVTNCYVYRKEINQKDCMRYLHDNFDDTIRFKDDIKPDSKKVLAYFQDFVDNKALELNHYNSQRVYNSLVTNLKEFEKEYALTFESINKLEFFYRFRDYSVKTLDHIDNTISKNVAILKSFLSYLQDNEIYTFKSALFNYSVSKTPAQVVTLTAEEIKQIYYCDKYDKFERQLIDVFVFLCVTSLRFSDYEEISKATIENNMLTKINKKTKTSITVPLNKTALEILAKYNGILPKYTNGYFNRELKEICKRCKLLQTPYKKTSIQNKKEVVKEGMKYEFITVHKSRASFITILIGSNTPLNEIMPITGHKLVSTLNAYTDKRINPEATNCITI